jgi:hypothetical protein
MNLKEGNNMTLSANAQFFIERRNWLSFKERTLVDNVFIELFDEAMRAGIPVAKDDRAAELEAAIIRFIIESREKA